MIAFRPCHSYNVCDMSLHPPTPIFVRPRRSAAPVPRRIGIRQPAGGSVYYLLCHLLFWLMAVGMAGAFPSGSSSVETPRAAHVIELHDHLFAGLPFIAGDEADLGQDDVAQGASDICDEGGLPHPDPYGSIPSGSLVTGVCLSAAPMRLSSARPSARAPPFQALG